MDTNFLLTVGIIVFVLIILNTVFLGILFFLRRRVAVVNTWPSTMGSVLDSRIEYRSSSDSGSTAYPIVEYTYQVGGQTYQNTKLAPGPEMGGTGAHKVTARYPIGAQVMVFYDPQKPSDAVLERKPQAQWFLWMMLIIFDCALCGVIPVIWFSMGQ